MPITVLNRARGGGSRAFDADVLSWRDAIVANGGSVSLARLIVVDQFVFSEKAAGNWALTDDYFGLWAENPVQALTSLKQRRLAVAVNSPAFTPDRNYTFNGATSYIDTGFVANSHAGVMGVSNVHIEAYERTNVSGVTTAIGVNSGSGRALSLYPRNGNALLPAPNMVGAYYSLNTPYSSVGLSQAGRTGATTGDIYCARNGVDLVQSLAPTNVGAALPFHSLFIGASNNNGTPAQFRAASRGFVACGAALDGTQRLTRFNNVQAWATSVGAQV